MEPSTIVEVTFFRHSRGSTSGLGIRKQLCSATNLNRHLNLEPLPYVLPLPPYPTPVRWLQIFVIGATSVVSIKYLQNQYNYKMCVAHLSQRRPSAFHFESIYKVSLRSLNSD